MKNRHPVGLNRRRVEQLLSRVKHTPAIADRIDTISRTLLGCPYKTNPLIGSSDKSEVFTASLAAFDCVTFIETVLALARSSRTDQFIEWLRRIRYDDGRVAWSHRNHYMIDWIRNSIRSHTIAPLSLRGVPTVARERRLDVIPDLPARQVRFKCVPKRAVRNLEPRMRTGDLMLFASTRANLDVFHAGIVIRKPKTILLRHAARSKGGVVEQDLGDFLNANRMAGVIVMRPTATA